MNNMLFMNISSYSVFWLDHLFVAIFALAVPIAGFKGYRKSTAKLHSGEISRIAAYMQTIRMQWWLALMAAVLWLVQGRSWAELGYRFSLDGGFMLAAALVVLVIIFFAMQLRGIRSADTETRDKLTREFKPVRDLMPQSGAELRAYYWLSLTAGIVEEMLWRGFLILYLSHFMPVWAAAIVSGILFGLAHAYQGLASLPKLCAAGLLLSGLFLLSGSLWLPMVLHVIVDALQGRAAFDLSQLRRSSGELSAVI
jgi:membrane protease YdiL (CAAX protease family)